MPTDEVRSARKGDTATVLSSVPQNSEGGLEYLYAETSVAARPRDYELAARQLPGVPTDLCNPPAEQHDCRREGGHGDRALLRAAEQ